MPPAPSRRQADGEGVSLSLAASSERTPDVPVSNEPLEQTLDRTSQRK
jgi:hypothetical protein